MRLGLALALLAALLAAGCVAPPVDPQAAASPAAAFVDPIVEDHEHGDLAAHALWTDGMEMLGHSALGDDGLVFDSFGEMDIAGSLGVVAARLASDGNKAAVVLVDLADPANLTRLGHATLPGATGHPLDVKFDEAGEYVYASAMGQIFAIDARDPAAPKLAGAMLPPGAACHMSAMGVVDGREWFWCTGDPTGLTAYLVVEAGDARALVPASQTRPDAWYQPVTGAGTFGLVGAPHDMTFQLDPVDGTPLLVVSNRGFGVRVLDVSNPALPVQLGAWRGEGAKHPPMHVHTAMATVVNGTRVVVASPEILPDDETPPAVWVLDATDYGAMALLAEWTAPGDHGSPGFTFTTHQWQVANERLYLGYYHAGVWVLDLAAILAGAHAGDARDDVLGYYLPHQAPVTEGAMVPNVWDVTLRHGVIFATDIGSGLYALHHEGDRIGDESATGFA